MPPLRLRYHLHQMVKNFCAQTNNKSESWWYFWLLWQWKYHQTDASSNLIFLPSTNIYGSARNPRWGRRRGKEKACISDWYGYVPSRYAFSKQSLQLNGDCHVHIPMNLLIKGPSIVNSSVHSLFANTTRFLMLRTGG